MSEGVGASANPPIEFVVFERSSALSRLTALTSLTLTILETSLPGTPRQKEVVVNARRMAEQLQDEVEKLHAAETDRLTRLFSA